MEGLKKMSLPDQKVQTLNYKTNKFWRYNVQHGYYSEQYCVVYLIVAKTVYLIVAKAVHLESFHHMHSCCNYIL